MKKVSMLMQQGPFLMRFCRPRTLVELVKCKLLLNTIKCQWMDRRDLADVAMPRFSLRFYPSSDDDGGIILYTTATSS